MKIVNLRDYYPFYTQDILLENSDEIARASADAKQLEHAINLRVLPQGVLFPRYEGWDRGIGHLCYDFAIEKELELTKQYRLLCQAINSLLYTLMEVELRHAIRRKKVQEIAESDGISCNPVKGGIKKVLAAMQKYMKGN